MLTNPEHREGSLENLGEGLLRRKAMARYTPEALKRAKRLRREMTPQECLLWSRLRNRQLGNHKFRKQQPLGPFIADFVCQEVRLVVEVDGSQHNDSCHDAGRDRWMQQQGYTVLRFWNNEVNENLEGVLEAILNILSRLPSPTATKRTSR